MTPTTPSLLAGRYRLGPALGQGGTASVHRARDTWRQRDVVLKILSSPERSLRNSLATEFATMARIHHPHVGRVEAIDHATDTWFLVQSFVEGVPSHEWGVDRSVDAVATVGAQIAAALATLHAHGIRHGDLKPHNILVAENGARPHGRLIDFGLATRGRGGTPAGTPAFLAPEVLEGDGQTASDVYGLGKTLGFILKGVSLPQHLGDALDALCAEQPARRPSAHEAFDLLRPHANDELESLRNLTSPPSHLCGRQGFLDGVSDLLQKTSDGPRVLRVRGEGGSGKSAALAEAMAMVIPKGFRAAGLVRPAGSGELGAVYQAVSEAVGSDIRPEVARVGDSLEGARYRAMLHLAEALESASRNEPLALAFDDVPPGSPIDQFAEFLRKSEGPSNLLWLDASTGPPHESVHHLGPLLWEDVERMVGLARPLRPHDAGAADALFRVSGGNPRLVVSLMTKHPGDRLAKAAQSGDLHGDTALHAAVTELIEALPEQVVQCAAAVAWAEGPVLLDTLQQLPDGEFDVSPEALDLLNQRELLQWSGKALACRGEAVAEILKERANPSLRPAMAKAFASETRLAAALGRLHLAEGNAKRAAEPLLRGARLAREYLNFPRALDLYSTLIEATQGDAARGAALERAELQLQLGKADAALEAFEDLVSTETTRDRAAEGKVRSLLALGRYSDAVEAAHAQRAQVGPETRAALDAVQARALLQSGRYDEAREFVVHLQQEQPDHPRINDLRSVDGLVDYFRGDYDRARAKLQTLVDHALAAGEDELADKGRANLALVLQKQSDWRGAEKAYEESLRAAQRKQDLPRQVRRLTNLATLRRDQDNVPAALEGFEQAHALAKLLDGPSDRVRIALNWAALLGWLGDFARSGLLARDALDNAEGLPTESAYLWLILAEAELSTGSANTARDHIQKSRSIFEANESAAGLAECDSLEAQCALRTADGDRAAKLGKLAAQAAREIGRDAIEAQALFWSTRGLLDQKRLEDADRGLRRLQEIASQRDDPHLGWMGHALDARLAKARGESNETELTRAREAASRARARLTARQEQLYSEVWYRRDLWQSVRTATPAPVEHATRSFDRLLAINRELASDHNPDRLLERIIDAAIALSGAERGFIVLREEDGEELTVRAARNMGRESLSEEGFRISRSIALTAMQQESPVTSIDAQDDDRFADYRSVHVLKLRSVLCLPLTAQDRTLGALYLDHRHRVSAFSQADVALLSAFGTQAAIALANAQLVSELENKSTELESSRLEIEELNQRLQRELDASTSALQHARSTNGSSLSSGERGRFGMVGTSVPMQKVYKIIERVSDKDVAVTIMGESGTGKELVARGIHSASGRAGQFVSVNCGAIPADLLESELFGHERGAFTGAVRSKPGLFEIAQDGTLFLDEIGDMPLGMQVKLLRVLQQREFRRVGGTKIMATNARVVSASNRDLDAMVRDGTFREDLWYRLNVVEVHVPPLRERKDDLPALIDYFLERYDKSLSAPAKAALLDYAWPGNIRELDNELQRAVALSNEVIAPSHLSERVVGVAAQQLGAEPAAEAASLKETVEAYERQVITAALRAHGGNVTVAAKNLGITRAGLYKKLNKYGLSVERD